MMSQHDVGFFIGNGWQTIESLNFFQLPGETFSKLNFKKKHQKKEKMLKNV